MAKNTLMLTLLAVSIMSGCGKSSDTPTTQTGIFLDSPVEGLHYTSGSTQGVTDKDGKFTYEAGQPITFSIGGIQLPPVSGGATITPLSVFDKATTYNDPRVINLARILQTLDSDGNPANGITIPPATVEALGTVKLTDFSDNGLTTAAAAITAINNKPLVTPAAAANHMQGQSIVGTWVIGGEFSPDTENGNSMDITQGNGFQVIVFLPDGTYIHGASRAAGTSSKPGIERGTYTWNHATGETTFKTTTDTNGDWGPSGRNGTFKIGPDSNTIEKSVDGKKITLKRVQRSATQPLVGTWGGFYPQDKAFVELIFLPTGVFMFLQDAPITNDQQVNDGGTPGIEWGTYTWVPDTGLFTPTIQGDTNGKWGFSHPKPGGTTITIQGNTFTITNANNTHTAPRLEP